jgi:hypothetical protein
MRGERNFARWLCPLLLLGAACGSGTGGGQISNDSLAGIWDVTATRSGSSPTHLTVTVDSNQLKVEGSAGFLSAVRSQTGFDVIWDRALIDGSEFRAVQVTPDALSVGALPINLSGQWSFEDIAGDPSYAARAISPAPA